MKNLRKQNGCWNCEHSFLLCPYDDPESCYCDITKDRPRSGDVWNCISKKDHSDCLLHDLQGVTVSEEEMTRRGDAWNEWSKKHEVHLHYPICDNWKDGRESKPWLRKHGSI